MTQLDPRTALLQALMSCESYGLELIDKVRDATNQQLTIPQGSVYPTLRALESEGLLESYDGPSIPERGGRPRRYYRITAEGRRVAQEQAHAIFGLFKPALGVA